MLKDFKFPGLEKNAYYWIDRAQYEESHKFVERALQCFVKAGEVNAKPSAPLLTALQSFIQKAVVENYVSNQGNALIHALNTSSPSSTSEVIDFFCSSVPDSKIVERNVVFTL